MECAAQGLSCPWTSVLIMAPMSPARGREAVLLPESFVLKVSEVSGDASQGREALAHFFAGRAAIWRGTLSLWKASLTHFLGEGMEALPPVPAPQQ